MMGNEGCEAGSFVVQRAVGCLRGKTTATNEAVRALFQPLLTLITHGGLGPPKP